MKYLTKTIGVAEQQWISLPFLIFSGFFLRPHTVTYQTTQQLIAKIDNSVLII